MSEHQLPRPAAGRRWVRPAVVVLGLLLPQVIQFGPSLVGVKVLLPLDLLAIPRIYLPKSPEYRDVRPGNHINLDKVLHYEPARRFAAEELRAGRWPTWQPYSHAGTPFGLPISLFTAMYLAVPDPVTLAWMQLAKAVLAGLGAFLFFRLALGVGFWPSAVGSWAFPLCGYMVFWQGHYLSDAATWLPWALFATDRAVRRPGGWGGPALGLAIGISALDGVLDVTAQTLLASGLYAMFRQVSERGWAVRPATRPAAVVVLGWAVGMLLGACVLLPLASFAGTGARIQERGSGKEERPPVGLSALPQAVLPFCEGTHEDGGVAYLGKVFLPESAATAYAGLLTLLAAVPLALADRRHRAAALFWCGVALLGMSWQLNVPGVVDLWRLPGFNLVSHNRDTLLTAFAVLAAGVLGLDALSGGVKWRRGFWVPVVLLAALGVWSLSRWVVPPEAIAMRLEESRQRPSRDLEQENPWPEAAERFSALALWGAAVCAAGLGWWAAAAWKFGPGPRAGQVLGGAIIAELILTGWGYNSQADPRLYYPPLPLFERLRGGPPGRILGVSCLPPNLSTAVHLSDVRGYDAVDPKRYVELLGKAANPAAQSPVHARTQNFVPRLKLHPKTRELQIPPILSLLGVRSLIFVGQPPTGLRPRDQGDGYYVLENPAAMPRAFVPRHAEPAPAAEELLARLGDDGFRPGEVAYVEGLAATTAACRGEAAFITDVPGHIDVRVTTDGPGVLVLADGWYEGWEAEVNGRPAPVLRADHALRAVEVPAGESTARFRYRPGAVRTGWLLSGSAGAILLLWAVSVGWFGRTRSHTPLAT